MSTQLMIIAARSAVAPLLLVNAVSSELTVCMFQHRDGAVSVDNHGRQSGLQAAGIRQRCNAITSGVGHPLLILCYHVWTS
jgi:hypothetical protein